MNDKKSNAKTGIAMAAGLLLGGAGLTTAAQAGCDLVNDPFLSGMMGMPVMAYMNHPCAQPHPGPSGQTFLDPMDPGSGVSVPTWIVTTPQGQFPPVDPFADPPGSNFLLNVNENLRDLSNREMPNTLPSTPTNPYNLHEGPVYAKKIDPTNPEDDLDMIIDTLEANAADGGGVDEDLVKFGIDILEGNSVDRAYSGFPMLHYNGPNKVKKIQPTCGGKKCKKNQVPDGGNVDVNLIYFGQHIEGDTAFVDPSEVQELPWTITYHVNILNQGMEDFSPMVMNFNRIVNPITGEDMRGPFHASMDQSFFPMLDEGTRYTVKIKENKGKYYNLTYLWGWRIHPPRVQVIENALKTAPPGSTKTLVQWEEEAFCPAGIGDPDCDLTDKDNKLYAISRIGDLSPAKRMWNLLQSLQACGTDGSDSDSDTDSAHGKDGCDKPKGADLAAVAADLRAAYHDWKDRTRLPAGVTADPDDTLTLLFVNNTIYGSRQGLTGVGSKLGPASYKGILNGGAHDWNIRPYTYKVGLLNGDHFMHGYMNVDFGGSRGWENHFQNTDPTTAIDMNGPHTGPTTIVGREFTVTDQVIIAGEENIFPINRGGTEEFLEPSPRNVNDPVNGDPQLGSGCFFTFGRNHAWPVAGGPWGGIGVMPAMADGSPGKARVEITFNYEPSRRLRIYQFDPLHHDVAIYSLH